MYRKFLFNAGQASEGANGGTPKPEMTFGEKAVATHEVNDSIIENSIQNIRYLAAQLIDELNRLREKSMDGEQKAQYTLAIRKIQEGKMWGVSATTCIL